MLRARVVFALGQAQTSPSSAELLQLAAHARVELPCFVNFPSDVAALLQFF